MISQHTKELKILVPSGSSTEKQLLEKINKALAAKTIVSVSVEYGVYDFSSSVITIGYLTTQATESAVASIVLFDGDLGFAERYTFL